MKSEAQEEDEDLQVNLEQILLFLEERGDSKRRYDLNNQNSSEALLGYLAILRIRMPKLQIDLLR